jgi:predicted hydrocarbon binding protein
MAEDKSSYFYPNRIGRILLRRMEESMGLKTLLSVLDDANLTDLANNYPPPDMELLFPFSAVSALQQSVEQVSGTEQGRQINREVGHAMLEGGLNGFDPILGIADLSERVLPTGMKVRVALDTFADVFNRFSDQVVKLSEDTHNYLWIIERCPVCWGRHTDAPCCHLAVGILERGLSWATGGAAFQVEETECVAAGGNSCIIGVSKLPIE